jgi:hypothetical protein
VTDPRPLLALLTRQDLPPRLARWAVKLQSYHFALCHRTDSQLSQVYKQIESMRTKFDGVNHLWTYVSVGTRARREALLEEKRDELFSNDKYRTPDFLKITNWTGRAEDPITGHGWDVIPARSMTSASCLLSGVANRTTLQQTDQLLRPAQQPQRKPAEAAPLDATPKMTTSGPLAQPQESTSSSSSLSLHSPAQAAIGSLSAAPAPAGPPCLEDYEQERKTASPPIRTWRRQENTQPMKAVPSHYPRREDIRESTSPLASEPALRESATQTGPQAPLSPDDWRRAQRQDRYLGACLDFLSTRTLPADEATAAFVAAGSRSMAISEEGLLTSVRISTKDRETTEQRILVPAALVTQTISGLHEELGTPHPGYKKLLSALQSRYTWPNMVTQIRDYAQNCASCRKQTPVSAPPESRKALAGRPFAKIVIEVLGPFTLSTSGYSWIVMITDTFTRWTELYPTRNPEPETVARLLSEEWCCRWGYPQKLYFDRGIVFGGRVCDRLTEATGSRKLPTATYVPKIQRLPERFNRVMIEKLIPAIQQDIKTWDRSLAFLLAAYRAASQDSIGCSPFEMISGQPLRLFSDQSAEAQSPAAYASNDYRRRVVDGFQALRQALPSPRSPGQSPRTVVVDRSPSPPRTPPRSARHLIRERIYAIPPELVSPAFLADESEDSEDYEPLAEGLTAPHWDILETRTIQNKPVPLHAKRQRKQRDPGPFVC